MAMLTKIAKDIEGLECIEKMCEKTKVPQELKEKMFSIYKCSIERKPVFAIASFAIALEENVGSVEDGLVDNVIYQMLREFDVTPDDYDCAKYE